MDIEKAKKILKCCMNDDCTKCEYADVFDCVKEHNEAIEIVLSELEKKETIINKMAELIYKHINSFYYYEVGIDHNNKDDVIEFFRKEVEKEGK